LITTLYRDVDQKERLVASLSDLEEQRAGTVDPDKTLEVRGGQIGWVFEKKNEEKGKKKEEEEAFIDEGVMDDSDSDED
jgi:hypothetical protein